MINKFWICLIAVFVSFSCAAQTILKVTDAHIRYSGRIAMTDSTAELSWSATSIKINFTGTAVSTTLKDERSDNNYNVIIDGKVISVLHPEMAKKSYVLASGLSSGKHTLELFKRTEWAMGKTWFYGFTLNNGGKILSAPPVPKRKIEFFGNSITCGYADLDTTGRDRGTSPYENGYISYAAE